MASPSPSLHKLPAELYYQIFGFLIPAGQIFRLKSCKPYVANDFDKKRRGRAGWISPFYQKFPYELPTPTTTVTATDGEDSPASASDLATTSPTLLTLLLIHPNINPVVLERFFSTNHFSCPNVFTLQSFLNQINDTGRSCISSVFLDARGRAKQQKTCTYTQVIFEFEPDHGIVETLALLPGLKELKLGGIGIGLVRATTFTCPRRGECKVIQDDRDVWELRGLELVASIVGYRDAIAADTVEAARKVSEDEDSDFAATRTVHISDELKGGHETINALRNGHIIHAKRHSAFRHSRRRGWLQLQGTRFVKRGEDVVLEESEQELVDLPAALALARWHHKAREEGRLAAKEDSNY